MKLMLNQKNYLVMGYPSHRHMHSGAKMARFVTTHSIDLIPSLFETK